MKRCIFCNKEIDDSVSICNYCGSPQPNNIQPQYNSNNGYNNQPQYSQSQPNNYDNNDRLKKQRKNLIVAIIVSIILIVAFIGFLMFLSKINSEENNSNNNTNDVEEKNGNGNIDDSEEKTFYGEGFSVKYSSKWKNYKIELESGNSQSALVYENSRGQVVFSQVGISPLEDMGIDFSTSAGKEELFNKFYEYWNESGALTKETNGFIELGDNVWYGIMDNNDTIHGLFGKVYLVVSEGNNAILSFEMQTPVQSLVSEANEEVLKMLDTLHISVVYDNQMADYLERMSKWNIYSSARSGSLGSQRNIEGEWRILSNSEVYWVFRGNEFYWYQSFNNFNDNYWYGTYENYTGKEALKKLGLDPNQLDSLMANKKGLKESDVYALILTPKKIIVEGEDKSSTNIPEGSTWNYLWVIVDHGEEGLEGQQANVYDGSENFFVKVKD